MFLFSFGLIICGFTYGGIYLSDKSSTFSNGLSKGDGFTEITNAKCYQNYPGITQAFENIIKTEESSGSKELKTCAYVAIIWNTIFLIAITGALVIIGPFKTLTSLMNAAE